MDVFLRIEIQRNKYLVVSITKETASFLLHAAISFSRAGSVMIKLVIIQWKGKLSTTNVFFPEGHFYDSYSSRMSIVSF